jgi:hypothetical protein
MLSPLARRFVLRKFDDERQLDRTVNGFRPILIGLRGRDTPLRSATFDSVWKSADQLTCCAEEQ